MGFYEQGNACQIVRDYFIRFHVCVVHLISKYNISIGCMRQLLGGSLWGLGGVDRCPFFQVTFYPRLSDLILH